MFKLCCFMKCNQLYSCSQMYLSAFLNISKFQRIVILTAVVREQDTVLLIRLFFYLKLPDIIHFFPPSSYYFITIRKCVMSD